MSWNDYSGDPSAPFGRTPFVRGVLDGRAPKTTLDITAHMHQPPADLRDRLPEGAQFGQRRRAAADRD